ncbi:MAG: TIGR02221 family CRISPR-associated protein [Tepidimonas sp.]|uniref:TIGR02221 family CRISPR-associated protein n=1 Tax=Tepidimonas sp. TaxID=2002775 RepID=UPI00259D4AE2|nr:TIGR02221 family CRISPR-associated protein [Tepidimonas sp.]MDM7457534.1 TIGR02221 family CRISPR-associated protein [Tepidimonas sp.]
MSLTLISFLGKSVADPSRGYRPARYRFADGTIHETPYFGLALAQQLRAAKLILIGTASSMWDVLIENTVGDAGAEESRLALMDAVREGQVDEALLERLQPAFARHLGFEIKTIVIPTGAAPADQQQLLVRLSDLLESEAHVAIDITHGFRHLAMLGLAATRYLQHSKNVCTQGLYYGALDMMQEGVAPVVELSGLAHLQEWAEALAAFDASGDFSRFAQLLERDGLDPVHTRALAKAWPLLAMNNVSDAARGLRQAVRALDEPLHGASGLFQERLRKSLRWVHETELHEQMLQLAVQALRRDDFLRAAILGLESFLARIVAEQGGDPLDYAARERAGQDFGRELRDGEHADRKRNDFWLLRNIRNALAHGTLPTYKPHAQLLKNPDRLRTELSATLNQLTNT